MSVMFFIFSILWTETEWDERSFIHSLPPALYLFILTEFDIQITHHQPCPDLDGSKQLRKVAIGGSQVAIFFWLTPDLCEA